MKRKPSQKVKSLAPRKPIKRRNPKRAKASHARAYGSLERIAFVLGLPSVVSGEGPCVNVHVRSGGTGRKADARWIVPMTDAEHKTMHQMGQKSYALAHNLDLDALAEETERAWQKHRDEHDLLTHGF